MGGPDADEAIDETTWHITMNCGQSAIHSSDRVTNEQYKAVWYSDENAGQSSLSPRLHEQYT